ncbi:hypothetical protein [Thermococcus sp.]|uniref:hypothetical protein n=1 Tax=Thermococcus sp. TaxID=35749 RepID=UPI00260CAF6D|nr:hypothetical protein [Thermococcus sp.]
MDWKYLRRILSDWPEDAQEAFIAFLKKHEEVISYAVPAECMSVNLILNPDAKVSELKGFLDALRAYDPTIPPVEPHIEYHPSLGLWVSVSLIRRDLDEWRRIKAEVGV